jgi:hypothetical protein
MSDTQVFCGCSEKIKTLRYEFEEFKKDAEAHERLANKLQRQVDDFQAAASSRRGLPGLKGDRGDVGPAGRDAVLIVKTDEANNVVRVFDESGKEQATIVSIPGKPGKDAAPAKDGRDGAPGKPGKDAPALSEIVAAVLQAIKSRI